MRRKRKGMTKLSLYSVESAKNGGRFEVRGLEFVNEVIAMGFKKGKGGVEWDRRDVWLHVLVLVLVLAGGRVV